jgi:flavin-binding protein dodecin
MEPSTMSPLRDTITQKLHRLTEAELHTVQTFVEYLIWKHEQGVPPASVKRSAEARAIERLKDLNDPTQWITVVEADDEVDEAALNHWLKERGYQD